MNFENFRRLFAGGSLIAVLVAASPALSLIITLPQGGERFSELWLLGPDRMAEGYPFNIRAAEPYSVYLGVSNHMGRSMYYLACVKLRNQTQPLPNATTSAPSPLPSLYELRAVVSDGETWEHRITFTVADASQSGNASALEALRINDRLVRVEGSALWDPEHRGFYYQLFFELWLYNPAAQQFQFHDRFVGIWLNMTG